MSSTSKSEKRRTVNMSEKIAEDLNSVANIQGKTAYSLINEAAKAAIEAFDNGFTIKEAFDAKLLIDKAKKNRLILVNQDLWYYSNNIIYNEKKSEWLKEVYEKGKWYGLVFLDNSSTDTFQKTLKELFQILFWDCNGFEIQENTDKTFILKAHFTPEMSLQHTEVVLNEIEGIINSIGYAIINYNIEKGYLRIILKHVPLPQKNLFQNRS